jgi:DNA-directed RNA polymerase subunit F
MSNYEVISTEPVSNAFAGDIIKKKAKEQELTYREEKVKDYLKNFQKLSKTDFEKARKELEALEIPRLDEMHLVKILDIGPQDGTELRAIVSHSGTVLVDENVDKILGVLKNYQK